VAQVLHAFPLEMQGDVAMHLHREVLSLPIFDQASHGCRKAIAMQIAPTFCTPGEYVLHSGDAVSGIYCVCNGSMEVLRDGMVVAILGKARVPRRRDTDSPDTPTIYVRHARSPEVISLAS